ncbi:MAG: BspA family leucine-rich repeat surface protein, partial [Clostridia bacterium]|nr:BspA family leucine-rich repeat surface protein [Clostridia bacterium]
MGLRKFFNRQVNIRFIKASSAVLITALFVILLSFSVKIFNSFADTVTPSGSIIYTDDHKDYYINCYTKEGTSEVLDHTVTDIPISTDSSLHAYLYSDGLLVLSGTGTLKDFSSATDLTSHDSNIKKIVVDKVNGFKPSSLAYIFNGLTNLEEIDLTGLDTTNATSMSHMFSGCTKIKYINLDGIYVNYGTPTIPVTDFSYMFYGCTSAYDINLDDIYLTSAITVEGMFDGCTNLRYLNLKSMELSKITDTTKLFDLSSLTNLKYMVMPLHINTSKVLNLPSDSEYKWYKYDITNTRIDATGYTSLQEHGISSNPGEEKPFEANQPYALKKESTNYLYTDSEGTIYSRDGYTVTGGSLNTNVTVYDITEEGTNGVRAYVYGNGMLVFDGIGDIKYLNRWGDDGYIQSYREKRTSITNAAFSVNGFKAFNCSCLFSDLEKLESIDFTNFDSYGNTWAYAMFYNCMSLTSLDLSSFETKNWKYMRCMFEDCNALTSITF